MSRFQKQWQGRREKMRPNCNDLFLVYVYQLLMYLFLRLVCLQSFWYTFSKDCKILFIHQRTERKIENEPAIYYEGQEIPGKFSFLSEFNQILYVYYFFIELLNPS